MYPASLTSISKMEKKSSGFSLAQLERGTNGLLDLSSFPLDSVFSLTSCFFFFFSFLLDPSEAGGPLSSNLPRPLLPLSSADFWPSFSFVFFLSDFSVFVSSTGSLRTGFEPEGSSLAFCFPVLGLIPPLLSSSTTDLWLSSFPLILVSTPPSRPALRSN